MANFRKKPVVIQAVQFAAADISTQEHVNFGWPKENGDKSCHPLDGVYWVSTLEGPLHVSEGDWIITGIKGEHYPCKPEIFESSYDAVE
jgi:hypothetical protein